ncbi:Conserved domain protein [Sulfidibacter corallicola]|uniref:IraD/Gp25-like domain-containing protein n=1 Tax=Sulfidibacter corallicola TaxID=2818388 RepID=A0A8A4TQX4_SULCO|nr:hypothetical protein [Sulfidibacter corallicola]QTD51361.1 hypothetical protein J3U87_02735 [Sulfidibacter corallicola]
MARDEHLLRDIEIRVTHRDFRPVYHIAETTRTRPDPETGRPARLLDLGTVSGRTNLAQAVIVRLLTPRGELAALGHPEFGSRLHEIIGNRNSETVRHLARLYILESLQREPRIEEVTALRISAHPDIRDRIDVELAVRPVQSRDTVSIGPFTLRLTP